MRATKVYSTVDTKYSTIGRRNIRNSSRILDSGNISKADKAKEKLLQLFNN